ncbi:MAG: hypothetical protein ACRCST_07495 [Turicibacter sp.]
MTFLYAGSKKQFLKQFNSELEYGFLNSFNEGVFGVSFGPFFFISARANHEVFKKDLCHVSAYGKISVKDNQTFVDYRFFYGLTSPLSLLMLLFIALAAGILTIELHWLSTISITFILIALIAIVSAIITVIHPDVEIKEKLIQRFLVNVFELKEIKKTD